MLDGCERAYELVGRRVGRRVSPRCGYDRAQCRAKDAESVKTVKGHAFTIYGKSKGF